MRWYHYIYIPEKLAADIGFTHHGTLFGVPAWLYDNPGEESFMACPKLFVLSFYTLTMDALLETLSYFLPETFEIATPYTLGASIGRTV